MSGVYMDAKYLGAVRSSRIVDASIWALVSIGTRLYRKPQALRPADAFVFFKVRWPKGEGGSAPSEVWARDYLVCSVETGSGQSEAPMSSERNFFQYDDQTRHAHHHGYPLKVHRFKKLVKEFAKVVHDSSSASSTSTSESSSSCMLPSPSKTPNNKTVKNWDGKVIFVNKTAPGSEWDGIIDYHVQ
ncbi:hypothetical protein BDY19DRAFT_996869 [Irpex rosettiformis]|uniref:Uncharacterized protein n=1 Tax=Irpex rosettiformis TaxID=378272 RepID=A0ACB8TTY5_9APHY|nr:hypothetical protein BDY19DRAFT_996869 [Irpex rosettiformis]